MPSAMEGVTVDLSGGNLGRGDAAGDSFPGIEQYVGSYHADIFIAGDDADNITGGPTTGGPGSAGDTSSDTVSYARSDEGVTVDLSSGSAQADNNGYARRRHAHQHRKRHRLQSQGHPHRHRHR